MSPTYRRALHNAPPTLSALRASDEDGFRRACAARHHANLERWLADREPGILNRAVERIGQRVARAVRALGRTA